MLWGPISKTGRASGLGNREGGTRGGSIGRPELSRHLSQDGPETDVPLSVRPFSGAKEMLDPTLDTHCGGPYPSFSFILPTFIHTTDPRFPFHAACERHGLW